MHVSTVRGNRTDTKWELSCGKLLISTLLSFSVRFLSFKNTLLEHHGVDFIAVGWCWPDEDHTGLYLNCQGGSYGNCYKNYSTLNGKFTEDLW